MVITCNHVHRIHSVEQVKFQIVMCTNLPAETVGKHLTPESKHATQCFRIEPLKITTTKLYRAHDLPSVLTTTDSKARTWPER